MDDKHVLNILENVNILNFRNLIFDEYLKFQYFKKKDPIDKKSLEYWRFVGMVFFNDPDIFKYEESNNYITHSAIELINKLNEIEDIKKKVILLTHPDYISGFNLLISKNIQFYHIVKCIQNLPN